VEVVGVRNNLIKELKVDPDDFHLLNTKFEDGVIANADENNNWNHLTR